MPGNQGEHGRMDLLTVFAHEIGHLLGREHEAESSNVMHETLAAGVRRTPPGRWSLADTALADLLFAAE